MNHVVVTGMYAISPAGLGLDSLWRVVRDGKPCGGPITRFNSSRNAAWIAAEAKDFDAGIWGIDANEAKGLDRATQFAITAAQSARQHAGLDASQVDPFRAGVCIGTAIGGVDSMEQAFNQLCCKHTEERKKPK
ncbi:MAG TPA: beta-ketoacyl synthase N-terminal-like domain-containing protein, partial [Candidatus Angelobacter sp.]|nr:beta-ketoacyl synthase N-terminal-like domain-containing protein [Candidatus Angelobacter sp.]